MRTRLLLSLICTIWLFSSSDAFAYPWFARRLVDNCTKCHSAFPKNNDYGWYVKTTGYELPDISYEGLTESPLKRFFRYVPATLRFKVDAVNSNPAKMEGDLNIRAAQFISGGSLFGNRFSWWAHQHVIENNEFQRVFNMVPHELWGQYNLHLGKANRDRLSFRYGMSELPTRFSMAKTKLSEMEYAVYNAMLGESAIMLGMPQYGPTIKAVRLGGESYNAVQSTFDLAFVNGTGDFSSRDFSKVFARAATTVRKTMVGAFTYFGSENIAMAMHHDEADPDGGMDHTEAPMLANSDFYRIGMDFDSNITSKANLYGLAVYAHDSNPAALETDTSGHFYGGFVGLDYALNSGMLFSLRYDAVRFSDLPAAEHHHEEGAAPDGDMPADEHVHAGGHHHHGDMVMSNTDAMVLGVQWFPIPKFYQIRLTAEYRQSFRGQSDKLIAGLQFAL